MFVKSVMIPKEKCVTVQVDTIVSYGSASTRRKRNGCFTDFR